MGNGGVDGHTRSAYPGHLECPTIRPEIFHVAVHHVRHIISLSSAHHTTAPFTVVPSFLFRDSTISVFCIPDGPEDHLMEVSFDLNCSTLGLMHASDHGCRSKASSGTHHLWSDISQKRLQRCAQRILSVQEQLAEIQALPNHHNAELFPQVDKANIFPSASSSL